MYASVRIARKKGWDTMNTMLIQNYICVDQTKHTIFHSSSTKLVCCNIKALMLRINILIIPTISCTNAVKVRASVLFPKFESIFIKSVPVCLVTIKWTSQFWSKKDRVNNKKVLLVQLLSLAISCRKKTPQKRLKQILQSV